MPPLPATPTLRRQIGHRSPWIFWRDHPRGHGRQGFACVVHACTNPGCPCTEPAFVGVFVDERLNSVAVDGYQLECDFDAAVEAAATPANPLVDPPCAVRLDFATRKVTAESGDALALDQLVAWLTGEVDDELVGELQLCVARQRAAATAPATTPDLWADWEPGDLMPHVEAFPEQAWGPFAWGGRSWLASDLHCIDPRCDCTEVRLVFARDSSEDDTDDPFAGTLLVTLPSTAPDDLEVEGPHLADRTELRALFDAFCTQHPDLRGELTARRAQARTLRPPSATVVLGQKVGRNDPCACGSGKKSKKCCGR